MGSPVVALPLPTRSPELGLAWSWWGRAQRWQAQRSHHPQAPEGARSLMSHDYGSSVKAETRRSAPHLARADHEAQLAPDRDRRDRLRLTRRARTWDPG